MDRKFILLMLVPAVIILGFIFFNLFTLTSGQEIVLEIPRPIDPIDLFRGNYVALIYDISIINLENISNDYEISKDETVYAILSKKEEYWTVDSISHSRQNLNEDNVCLKGLVTAVYGDELRIKWGIESFFSSLDSAKEIEDRKRQGSISSIVTVDAYCNSILKALLVGNETIRTN